MNPRHPTAATRLRTARAAQAGGGEFGDLQRVCLSTLERLVRSEECAGGCVSSASVPVHRILDAKLVDVEVLAHVLDTWLNTCPSSALVEHEMDEEFTQFSVAEDDEDGPLIVAGRIKIDGDHDEDDDDNDDDDDDDNDDDEDDDENKINNDYATAPAAADNALAAHEYRDEFEDLSASQEDWSARLHKRGLCDTWAIAFMLTDARFAWSLLHRYHVKRTLPLRTVLSAYSLRLAILTSTTASSSSSSSRRVHRLLPSFNAVQCDDPQLYSTLPPLLLDRIVHRYFSFVLDTRDEVLALVYPSVPAHTTMLGVCGDTIVLTPRMLPDSVRLLMFREPSTIDHPIGSGVLPSSLQKLVFGAEAIVNRPFDVGVLPASLKQLIFTSGSMNCHSLRPRVLPASLELLALEDEFPLNAGVLPASLRRLVIGIGNDLPIRVGVLPASLRELIFRTDGEFNQPIDVGVLPPSLKRLTFGMEFEQPVEKGVWPSSLRHIVVQRRDQIRPVARHLPAGCIVLYHGKIVARG